jgi:hypothetical protein
VQLAVTQSKKGRDAWKELNRLCPSIQVRNKVQAMASRQCMRSLGTAQVTNIMRKERLKLTNETTSHADQQTKYIVAINIAHEVLHAVLIFITLFKTFSSLSFMHQCRVTSKPVCCPWTPSIFATSPGYHSITSVSLFQSFIIPWI